MYHYVTFTENTGYEGIDITVRAAQFGEIIELRFL